MLLHIIWNNIKLSTQCSKAEYWRCRFPGLTHIAAPQFYSWRIWYDLSFGSCYAIIRNAFRAVYCSGGVFGKNYVCTGYWRRFPVLNRQSFPSRPKVVEICSALSMRRERWLPLYNTESLISWVISNDTCIHT